MTSGCCTIDDRLRNIERDVDDIKEAVSKLAMLFDPWRMQPGLVLRHIIEIKACGTDKWMLFAGHIVSDQMSLTMEDARKLVQIHLYGEEGDR